MLRKLLRKIKFLLNIPKTIYINFRTLPFKQAIHLPIYAHRKVKFVNAKKGSIVLEGKIRRGNVSIGSEGLPIHTRYKPKGGVVSFSKGSKITIQGEAHIAALNTILLAPGAELVLGAGFSTNTNCLFLAGKKIAFDDDCFLGWNITVCDNDGHRIVSTKTNEVLNEPREVHIGSHVWICSDVKIMKGVTVADNCVIASNTLVTKSLTTPSSIYGGSPVRVLKNDVRALRWKVVDGEHERVWSADYKIEKQYIFARKNGRA